MTDLEDSIRVKRKSVDATPKDHPDRSGYLSSLGNGLGDRFARTGAMADLEESIRVKREAVEATPEDHPDRAARLNSLGSGLRYRFLRKGATADLEEAISYFQLALRQETSPTDIRVQAGQGVLRSCALPSYWQQAYEASDLAVPLIPKINVTIPRES